ncbi:MAG: DUF3450 family protein [Verrucomicrobiota bacterium]
MFSINKLTHYTVFSRGFVASILAVSSLQANIRDTQDELIAWVETEKAIAETKGNWEAEKEIVNDLIALLETKKEKLTSSIEELEETSDATDTKRSELNADRERLVASTEALESAIPKLEENTRSFVKRLPKPLMEELAPLIRRLPEPETKVTLPVSQRLLTVVGILNKIDKFNSSISVVSEIKATGERNVEVTTLYIGLAGAFFADASGDYAGVGKPGDDGWVWTEDTAIAKDVVDLIDSYQGASEAKFVELPLTAL